MNSIYDIFNYQYIQQQAQQQHHINQVFEIQKCAKALRDFLDGVDKIEPNYRQIASAEFSAIIFDYIRKHR